MHLRRPRRIAREGAVDRTIRAVDLEDTERVGADCVSAHVVEVHGHRPASRDDPILLLRRRTRDSRALAGRARRRGRPCVGSRDGDEREKREYAEDAEPQRIADRRRAPPRDPEVEELLRQLLEHRALPWWTSVRGTVLLSDLTIKMVLAGMVRLGMYMDYLLVQLAPDGYHHTHRGFSSRIRRARHRERGLGPRCSRVRREGGGTGRDRDEGLAPVV